MTSSGNTPPGIVREVIAESILLMPPPEASTDQNIAQYLPTIEAVKTRPAHLRAHGRRIK